MKNHLVKQKPRGRPKASQTQLSSNAILVCAKQLMRTHRKVPSIRTIAATLAVDAMAIYHYYANKNALLEAITVSLISQIYEPQRHHSWEIQLERLCKTYLNLLGEYPGLLQTILSMSCEGPSDVFSDRFNRSVAQLNLNNETAKYALDLIADYLHGFALACSCNNSGKPLELDMINGPLKLYVGMLNSLSKE